MKRNIKYSFLILVMLLSSVGSILLASPSARANATIEDQVKTYTLANAIARCFQHSGLSDYTMGATRTAHISRDNLMSGQWFYEGNHTFLSGEPPQSHTAAGPMVAPQRPHNISCHGSEGRALIQEALRHFGVSATDVVCGMGWGPEGGGDCNNSLSGYFPDLNNRTHLAQSFINTVTRLSGKNMPNLSDPMRYYIARSSFAALCSNERIGVFNPRNNADQNRIDNGTAYIVSDITADGTVEQVMYQTPSDASRDNSKVVFTAGSNNYQMRSAGNGCRTLAEWTVSYANTYAREGGEALNLSRFSDPQSEDGENGTTCAIDGVGWIICPIINFGANIMDRAYSFLEDTFLRTDIQIFQETNTQVAWGYMRNIANVAFVIVFLIIIVSQVSSVGINNYNIKKMLPRLIVAAILVNISYFLTQLAVDISNITGSGIKSLFESVPTAVDGPDGMNF
jgi:hypothetical protein